MIYNIFVNQQNIMNEELLLNLFVADPLLKKSQDIEYLVS
jgi:hypothetical protein